jgi:type VI secretion system VasD/TssJ family lipoprotein
MTNTWLHSAVLAGVVAVVSACASPPPPPTPLSPAPPPAPPPPCTTPEPLHVTLNASIHLNPGENGESLATTIRIYQLKDTGRLVEATLDRILDGDRAVLGEDLISVQELTLYPGERATPTVPRSEAATSLVVVAFFRRPIGASWRAIRVLAPPDPQHCHKKVPNATSQLRFTLEGSRVDMR